MWKLTEPYIVQNKPEVCKSVENIGDANSKIYQRKQINNIKQNNVSPFRFDFNFYFGNSRSSCFSPFYQIENQSNNSHLNNISPFLKGNLSINDEKDYICSSFKYSLEKSGYKLNSSQVIYFNPNVNSNQRRHFFNNYNSPNNINRNEVLNNKNRSSNFNDYQGQNNTQSNTFNNIYPPCAKITIIQNLSESKTRSNIDEGEEKEDEITKIKEEKIPKSFSSSPNSHENNNNNINKKQKIIFECSGSDVATNGSLKSHLKKKRFRKNNEQLVHLSSFYSKNKNWSKKQIKEISERIGLKENKIYKWLWDQKNKEFKANKFIVNKGKCK